MRRRAVAIGFLCLCLVGLAWYGMRSSPHIDGSIERVDIPQLYITSTADPNTVRVILLDEQTEILGKASRVQHLKAGQVVRIELVPRTNLNLAQTIEVK